MIQDHEPPKSSNVEDVKSQFRNVKYPTKSYEKIQFYDVKKDLCTWKKENTCQSCWITFENFQVLCDHKCLPYRCAVCLTAFQHDFMLNMHQCRTSQSTKNSRRNHFCEFCESSFPEKSGLLHHQTSCMKKKKLCEKCGRQLPVKSVCDFCRKCKFLLEKDKKYSLRCNSSTKLQAEETGIEANGNGLHLLTDNEEVAEANQGDYNENYLRPTLNNLKRKRRSLDGSLMENACKKKTFESNTNPLAHSDSSLDNLDPKCKFKNKVPKKDIESNLKNSLVTVLKNSSEKKSSDQSSTSKRDLGNKVSKTSIFDSPCNGITPFPMKSIKKHNRYSNLYNLEQPFSPLSSSRVKRNCKQAELEEFSEPCESKSSPKSSTLSELSSETDSTDKSNETLPPLRKSKRNICNRKARIDSAVLVDKQERKPKMKEFQTSSAKSFDSVDDSDKDSLIEKKNSHAQESDENSSSVSSVESKVETSSSESSVENSEVLGIKKKKCSPRLHSVQKSPVTRNRKSPEPRTNENPSISVRSSLRKSRRNAGKDDSVESRNVSKDSQTNGRNSSVGEKKKSNPLPVSEQNGKNTKNNKKKASEKSLNESFSCKNSKNTNSVALDSSTSRSEGKKSSSQKNSVSCSYVSDHDRSRQASDAEGSNEVSVLSSKKSGKNVSKSKKNSVSRSTSPRLNQGKKVDDAPDAEKRLDEMSTLSKLKPRSKDIEKAQNEAKKLNSKSTLVKGLKTPETSSSHSRRGSNSSGKQIANASKPSSRNKNNSSVRCNQSSINYTPELEVSESTLNLVPDMLFLTSSTPMNSHSSKSSAKSRIVSNSENDSIKLESLMNVLPDGDCGLILRVPSNTTDNYRCLKCNKLFKSIKMASTHYGNCKTNRVKKATAVFLKDILWICVQCNFYCHQMSELNFHRQSCLKSSNDVSIDNCIKNYNNTCLKYCSKCSFSCISSITFNKHPCEQRLEQMSKCVIDLEKVSIKKMSIKKYECNYCESTFLNYNAYKKHIEKHQVYSDERTIKHEPLDSSEKVINRLLQPGINSQKHSLLSTLNLLMPQKVEPLLSEAAGKVFNKDADTKQKSFSNEIAKVLSLLGKGENSSSPFNMVDLETQVSSETWRTYMKDYSCRCKMHKNTTEEKPCLACLNTYIKKRGGVTCQSDSSTQTDLPLVNEATMSAATSVADMSIATSFADMSAITSLGMEVTTSSAADMSIHSCAQSLTDNLSISSSLDGQEMPSIHITSVSSCTNPVASVHSTSGIGGCLSDIPSFSSLSFLQNGGVISSLTTDLEDDKFPQHVSSDSVESKLFINLILILKGNFVDSKYTIEKHNNLVKSIYKLKFGKLAEPVQVHPDQYYLLTEYIPKPGDESSKHLSEYMSHTFESSHSKLTYDESVLQNYFLIDRPFTELMPLFVSQEPCDFDVVLCNNSRYFIHLSWQFAPEICYSGYCVKADSEPTGLKLICGLCFDFISIHLLIEHFDKVHEGAYTYNILIS